jgi:hydrogenase nickel incorporation protein HypA/HybF
MHEMSLAESVREIAIDVARQHGANRVRSIEIVIGRLASVEMSALRFGLDVVLRGGVTDGATLQFTEVAGQAWCWDCAATVEIASSVAECPRCGSTRLQVTGGCDLRVGAVELDEIEGESKCA